MRLTEKELAAIISVFKELFLVEDHVWLFGSRTDDSKKGGDIDLYIETNYTDYAVIFEKKIRFKSLLKLKIGDQKIDDLVIYDEAQRTGIKLI